MSIYTTYTVKSRNFPNVWLFKYDLNGFLKEWILEEGELTEKQKQWLFTPHRFPYLESDMKTHIMAIKNLQVMVGEPDLSFELFYKNYNNPVGKKEAEKAHGRLSKADKLDALKGIKPYDSYLKRSGVSKAYPASYLNKRRWESNYNAI